MNSVGRNDSAERQLVDRELFKEVIGHFATGVTIITARHEGTDYGLTANAVSSLSLDPPMLVVCIHKETGTCNAVSHSKVFTVNILRDDQGELAMQFAKPEPDKFRGTSVSYGVLGEPFLENVLAHLECRVAEEVTGGTHSVFLAEVQSARAKEGDPLAYFRGQMGRFEDAADEEVYGRIRQQVLTRELPVGEPIDAGDLAERLDVPRQSVYYAMTKLSGEDLVSRESEEGEYVINPLDAEAFGEAIDARYMLEVAAAEQAIGNISDAEVAELRARAEATGPTSRTVVSWTSSVTWRPTPPSTSTSPAWPRTTCCLPPIVSSAWRRPCCARFAPTKPRIRWFRATSTSRRLSRRPTSRRPSVPSAVTQRTPRTMDSAR